jgi:hypothetical protein
MGVMLLFWCICICVFNRPATFQVELRASLVLSILQQLAEDTADMVRQAVVQSLAVLATLTYDNDKYPLFESLATKCLADRSERVVMATQV